MPAYEGMFSKNFGSVADPPDPDFAESGPNRRYLFILKLEINRKPLAPQTESIQTMKVLKLSKSGPNHLPN